MITKSYEIARFSNISLRPSSPTTTADQKEFQFKLNRAGQLKISIEGHTQRVGEDGEPIERPIRARPLVGRAGEPGTGDPGIGDPPPPPSHPVPVDLGWTLFDPNGALVQSRPGGSTMQAPPVTITREMLDRFRDLAGFCSRPWRLLIRNPFRDRLLTQGHIRLHVTDQLRSESAPVLFDRAVNLQPAQAQEIAFTIDRAGELRCTDAAPGLLGLAYTLIGPDGQTVITMNDVLTYRVTLRDLARSRRPTGEAIPWRVRVLLRNPNAAGPHRLTGRILEHLVFKGDLFLSRIGALLGPSGDGLIISAEYEGDDTNSIFITVNSRELYETFNTLDIWAALEEFVAEKELKPVTQMPRVQFQVPFRLMKMKGLKYEDVELRLRGFKTQSIHITLGSNADPTVNASIVFAGSPKIERHKDGILPAPDVHLWNVRCDMTIRLWAGSGRAVASPSSKLSFDYNINNVPDGLAGDLRVKLTDGLNQKLKEIGEHITDQIERIMVIFLGGLFDITQVSFLDNSLVFTYVPGREVMPASLGGIYRPGRSDAPSAPWTNSPNLDKIDRIVVLMMENRSFDHVLGHLSLPGGRSDVDGLTSQIIQSFPADIRPAPLTGTKFELGPCHEYECVERQLASQDGFVLDFLARFPDLASGPNPAGYTKASIMAYHTRQTLPFHDFLAREYGISDRWFSSHPGPTFPNRFFFLMGKLSHHRFGEPDLNQPAEFRMLRDRNIFDLLTERNVTWTYFESPPDVSMLRTFARYAFDDQNIRPMQEFFTAARQGTLPSVTFLDPHFHSSAENDDHPPTDMVRGHAFLEEVYAALISNPQQWSRTLFIITYDEHGGFYDHVPPQTADVLKRGSEEERIRYGVRVPAFFVSPWVERGKCHRSPIFDHTSILKSILLRFCRPDPPFLSDRVLWANDLGSVLSLSVARTDRPAFNVMGPRPPLAGEAQHDIQLAGAAAARARIDKLAPRPDEALKDWHEFMGNLALIKTGAR